MVTGDVPSMMTADDTSFDEWRPQARSDLLVRDLEGGVVAWSPRAAEPVVLESLPATLLGLMDGEVSAGGLVADLGAVLDVSENVARDVLRTQVTSLLRAGLLVWATPTADPGRAADVFPVPPDP